MSLSRAISLLLLSALLSLPASAKKDLTLQERYDLGQKYAKRGYYVKALEEFNVIRNNHRDDPLAIKAELAIADVYYRKAEWDQARVAYEDFMRMNPRHEDIDYVVYRLGMTAYKKASRIPGRDQTWTRQAVNAWSGFEGRYPESEHLAEVDELLSKCRNRLAKKEYQIGAFYVQREAWPAVQARMEGLLRQYPDAELAPDALGLLALSQQRQGAVEPARESVKKLLESYPDSDALKELEREAPDLF